MRLKSGIRVINIFACSLVCFSLFSFFPSLYAEEITILYTGETHAMLYPCNCPSEPDGGIARRASFVHQLKENNPNVLFLDSGAFFAGGVLDEYSQNAQIDMQRTQVNLRAMEIMKYDAVAVGDEEFGFGLNFLQENIAKINFAFLACNISGSDMFKPYIIKELTGIKIGVIGVIPAVVMLKAVGLKFVEPRIAVSQAVEELKKNGVDIIILLSHLGENEDLELVEKVAGIDILIQGHSIGKGDPSQQLGSTLFLRPAWQGRRIGKAILNIQNKKITGHSAELMRLSNKLADDAEILSILPKCFSDGNCKKEGYAGICKDPGSLDSCCFFSEVNKINLSVISSKSCLTCETDKTVAFLRGVLPGLKVSFLDYPSKETKKLIKDYGIEGLPAYILGKEVEKEKAFVDLNLENNAELKNNCYVLKPYFTGLSYFLNRENIKGQFDLFISLFDKNTEELLNTIEEFNPSIHFLAVEENGEFDSVGGNIETEESIRAVCIQKHYPQYFWKYIKCRAQNINTSWWSDCMPDLDMSVIKACAKGDEGRILLKENIALNKELQVMFGPTYLVDNNQIFSSKNNPAKEELERILKNK